MAIRSYLTSAGGATFLLGQAVLILGFLGLASGAARTAGLLDEVPIAALYGDKLGLENFRASAEISGSSHRLWANRIIHNPAKYMGGATKARTKCISAVCHSMPVHFTGIKDGPQFEAVSGQEIMRRRETFSSHQMPNARPSPYKPRAAGAHVHNGDLNTASDLPDKADFQRSSMGGVEFIPAQFKRLASYQPQGKGEAGNSERTKGGEQLPVRVNRHPLTDKEVSDLFTELWGFISAALAFLFAYLIRRGMR